VRRILNRKDSYWTLLRPKYWAERGALRRSPKAIRKRIRRMKTSYTETQILTLSREADREWLRG
jgi:hypothetical protein